MKTERKITEAEKKRTLRFQEKAACLKADGYEENKILVFVNQDNYWRSYVCRQLAFIYDLSYDEIIDKLIHEEQ